MLHFKIRSVSDGSAWGALSIVLDTSRLAIVDTRKLVQLVTEGAARIGARLT